LGDSGLEASVRFRKVLRRGAHSIKIMPKMMHPPTMDAAGMTGFMEEGVALAELVDDVVTSAGANVSSPAMLASGSTEEVIAVELLKRVESWTGKTANGLPDGKAPPLMLGGSKGSSDMGASLRTMTAELAKWKNK